MQKLQVLDVTFCKIWELANTRGQRVWAISIYPQLGWCRHNGAYLPLHSLAFFKILKSPTIQLPGAGKTRAWHYHGSATPTSRNIFLPFLSEVMEAEWGWWNKNWMFYIKSSYLRIPKIIGFWLQCHWIMKKCSSEMHQFEFADPLLSKQRNRTKKDESV